MLVWRSRPSQEEEGLVKCLYGACVSGMQLATTLWSKSATFHVQLGVLSSTVNRACVSASLGSSVHVVVSLRKPTTDTYLWGRPDSGSLPRARYRHLTRPSSSCPARVGYARLYVCMCVSVCICMCVCVCVHMHACVCILKTIPGSVR